MSRDPEVSKDRTSAIVFVLFFCSGFSGLIYQVIWLRMGGILQQRIPGDSEDRILEAVVKSLSAAFPYVVAYRSVEDWGYHFLASMQPVSSIKPEEMVARMPDAARQDLIEWGPMKSATAMATAILARRTSLADLSTGRSLFQISRTTGLTMNISH